uniref:DUSP domain-containing protein n=1 Tax=Octactis speculum TaxID=3111310 RepID=A0A7S2DAT7_9STRA|mmetsp:Transcript_46236/g.62903  ORF Transcript_46236/g.62903 Transcript_46236/m.62903 type:complete len:270 (+) Transcript_46236:74-883(+)|eukprot:CAMPEP_0185772902 /NCGR_PEP_ID=MMETSP1174-20130828/71649_1 /TAXON_ID=35687 /ORGANISM="Dictyocha speculum, Strain CCMP1381" /LENGTH=269 /DNA_ID=CAMNT_0028459403 /DNA_START=59 /DNA_END=868 /DNA_ORIENTATION=-
MTTSSEDREFQEDEMVNDEEDSGEEESKEEGEWEDELGALSPEEKALLEERRYAEYELVKKFDVTEINIRRECWFLINTIWFDEWLKYMSGKVEPPDRISNLNLYEEGGQKLKPNLQAVKDYRGVSATVWYIFVELYGSDNAPEICRYTVNIDDPPVVGTYREQASRGPELKARIEVAKMRESFYDSSDSEEEEETHLCCCLHKYHVDSCLFHVFTCCKFLGRKGPRYARLKQRTDDFDDEFGDDENQNEADAGASPDAPDGRKDIQLV